MVNDLRYLEAIPYPETDLKIKTRVLARALSNLQRIRFAPVPEFDEVKSGSEK